MVYTKGAEDLEFAHPANFGQLGITFRSTDVTEQPQNALSGEESNTIGADPIEPIGDVSTPERNHINEVFMGEAVHSIRAFLRRYRTKPGGNYAALGAWALGTGYTAQYPVREDITAGTSLDVREFLMASYIGWRGSIRFKTLASLPGIGLFGNFRYVGEAVTQSADMGAHANNNTLEVEIPYYSRKRFSMCRTSPTWVANTDIDTIDPNNLIHDVYTTHQSSYRVANFTATGEDFSLFFFAGLPPFYKI
jgi:hypothetical protein